MVNYPEPDVGWTRIAEYKHTPNQPDSAISSEGTVIYREYSTDEGDPYYPVPNPRNQELYKKYQALSLMEENVVFVGRLASYKYFFTLRFFQFKYPKQKVILRSILSNIGTFIHFLCLAFVFEDDFKLQICCFILISTHFNNLSVKPKSCF